MANTVLAPVPFGFIPGAAGVDLTPTDWPSVAAATGVTVANDGRTVIAINNGSASPLVLTPLLQHPVQGVEPALPTFSLPAGKVQGFGPFPVADFGKTVTITFTGVASVTAQAFEMTTA